jgi:hypothetical protein
MADHMTVSACDEELDPLLVHAVRLFVVTLLADMQWRIRLQLPKTVIKTKVALRI